jgi:hypothetical protein
LALGLLILTIGGGITGYVLTQADTDVVATGLDRLPADRVTTAELENLGPGMTPVGAETSEDMRVQQYMMDTNHRYSEFVLETASLRDPIAEKRPTEYVNPVIPADQMGRKTSY